MKRYKKVLGFSVLSIALLLVLALAIDKIALDRIVALRMSAITIPALTKVLSVISLFGNKYVIAALSAFVAWLLYKKGRPFANFVFVIVGGYVSCFVLKLLINRPRPSGLPLAFPSGHATFSILFYSLLLLLFLRDIKNKRLRNLVIIACILLVLLISFGRIYLGSHWLSDTLAGWLLGFFWITVFLLKRCKRKL